MKYYRPIIAIPCEQARKAGAKSLSFKYVDLCAKFFGINRDKLYKKIEEKGTEKKHLPYKGFYFEWEIKEND